MIKSLWLSVDIAYISAISGPVGGVIIFRICICGDSILLSLCFIAIVTFKTQTILHPLYRLQHSTGAVSKSKTKQSDTFGLVQNAQHVSRACSFHFLIRIILEVVAAVVSCLPFPPSTFLPRSPRVCLMCIYDTCVGNSSSCVSVFSSSGARETFRRRLRDTRNKNARGVRKIMNAHIYCGVSSHRMSFTRNLVDHPPDDRPQDDVRTTGGGVPPLPIPLHTV